MDKSIKVFLIFLLCIGFFAAGFWLGTSRTMSLDDVTGILHRETPPDIAASADFNLFWESWRFIEGNYVESSFDYQKMVHGAIAGLVKSLGDPYSSFLDPTQAKLFEEDVSGEFEGIGAEIGFRKDILSIIAPLKNTPAERAGLRAGDKIFKINETVTVDLSLEEAVSLIRGPKGTVVELSIVRDDSEKPLTFKITRGVIAIPSVEWTLEDGHIAHIQIYNFYEKTIEDFQGIVPQVLASGADRVIVDLRNNPGGLLDASVKIAGFFLKRDSLVVTEQSRKERREHRTTGSGALADFPMVVLVNGGSASASEILAGALKDNRNVSLIGEKTFGKGSVQILEELRDGSNIKLTIAKWLTPNGTSLTDSGLAPDIEVKRTEEDIENDRDPQLEKAIEIVRGL